MSAPVRITLGVPNDSKPIPVSVASNKQRKQIDVTAPINAEKVPKYEGPYSVTPTESEQVLETDGKRMEDNVAVGAIPSDYVGSGVPRKTSEDLTASGPTVTAPAGYYASASQKSIPNATIGHGGTFHIVPNMAVDSNGVVSCSYDSTDAIMPIQQSGYADSNSIVLVGLDVSKTLQLPTQPAQTITPTTTDQTIDSGKYLTGVQTISAIAPPYYDMSGKDAWLGADATLVKEITLTNVKLADTAFASWTPSTTATDILATRAAGTFTASNTPDYDYYICWETVIPIEYQSGAVDKARGIYLAAYHVQAIVRRASSYANYQAGNTNNNINVSAFTGGNFYRYYGSTQGTITYTNSTSYGFYGTVTANTISSATAASPTITLNTPKITARCSTTYMSTANAALIDQDKTVIKQKCRVYRVKKSSFMQGVWEQVMRLVQEIDPE